MLGQKWSFAKSGRNQKISSRTAPQVEFTVGYGALRFTVFYGSGSGASGTSVIIMGGLQCDYFGVPVKD